MRLKPYAGTTRASTSHSPSLWRTTVTLSILAGSRLAAAIKGIEFDIDDHETVKKAASNVAYNMMTFYTGNRTGDVPGNLPEPYYWWEAGAMMGSLIDYYYYTNDSTYNDVVIQAMVHQSGDNADFMVENQTKTTGNDDQGFWGMSAMAAAEQNFPNPPEDQPQWLELVQGVFNDQANRWDTQFCNGGLRWQVFSLNTGYDYKNTISNGVFFNLAARLAVYTKNDTYADWAIKAYDWTKEIGFMDDKFHFYDGAHTPAACKDLNKLQWTYNAGVYLLGSAAMYNYTSGSKLWRDRVLGILNATDIFFDGPNKTVMVEMACEAYGTCNTDNFSFKAYLSRWLAASTKYAPFVYDMVMPKLRGSAIAAAQQCSGGDNGQMCGMRWTQGAKWDGTKGVGQQMGALEVIQSNLIDNVPKPVTQESGGTSKGNPSGGGDPVDPVRQFGPVKTSDRAGAGILTALVLIWLLGGLWWMFA